MCRQPLPPPLSPPSAKLMIMALEEYGYQSRRGIRVRAIEIPGWTPDLDDQNDEESDSEDEECEKVFKKDFGESDEEVHGENNVSRVSDTDVEEENPKSKDGVVSSEQNGKQSEDPF
ncbi:hypothetical protein Tco_1034247, partial [Tanacetum coccineum]